MKAQPLAAEMIYHELQSLPGWSHAGREILKNFMRADFDDAIVFVNGIARLAAAADHHPELSIAWNIVTVRLTSYDAGGITERDFALARKIDELERRCRDSTLPT